MAPIRLRAFICNSAVIGGIPASRYTASFAVRSGRDSSCFNVLRWYLSRASRWDFLNINVSSPYMQRGTTYSSRMTTGLEPLLPWKPAPIRAYDARRAVGMHWLMMVEFDGMFTGIYCGYHSFTKWPGDFRWRFSSKYSDHRLGWVNSIVFILWVCQNDV